MVTSAESRNPDVGSFDRKEGGGAGAGSSLPNGGGAEGPSSSSLPNPLANGGEEKASSSW